MPRAYASTDQARGNRTAQRTATRAALLDSARTLFADKGYDGVSVTEIGAMAGVSHSLINQYFDGKAGLLYALVTEGNAPQWAPTKALLDEPGPVPEKLRRVLEAWAAADLRDPRLLAVMQAHAWTWSLKTEAENRAERDRYLSRIAEALAVHWGDARSGRDPRAAAEAIFAIYTWGCRDAVFGSLTPKAAVDALWPQVALILGPC